LGIGRRHVSTSQWLRNDCGLGGRFGHGISLAGEVGWLTILTIEEADGCEGVHTAANFFEGLAGSLLTDGADKEERKSDARYRCADSRGSRSRIRDDVAQHSDLMSLGVPR